MKLVRFYVNNKMSFAKLTKMKLISKKRKNKVFSSRMKAKLNNKIKLVSMIKLINNKTNNFFKKIIKIYFTIKQILNKMSKMIVFRIKLRKLVT